MKFVARPIEVDAFKIVSVAPCRMSDGSIQCILEDGRFKQATPAMTSRMDPKVGDYWVVQPDGYEYLNPMKVFISKYEPFFTANF